MKYGKLIGIAAAVGAVAAVAVMALAIIGVAAVEESLIEMYEDDYYS